MQQEFAIALRAEDRRVDDFDLLSAERNNGLTNFGNSSKLGLLTAHDSALADQLPANFKLRLDEQNKLPAELSFARESSADHSG